MRDVASPSDLVPPLTAGLARGPLDPALCLLLVHAGTTAAAQTTPQTICPESIGPFGTTLPGPNGTQDADGKSGASNNSNGSPGGSPRRPLDETRSISPDAQIGRVHDFTPARPISAEFLGTPGVSFQALGVSGSRDSAITSVGAKVALAPDLSANGSFIGRFSGRETSYGGFAGLQLSW